MKKNFFNPNSERAFHEILFENRNKAYGAYVLRTEQNEVMKKAVIAGVSFFAMLAFTPFLIQQLKPEAIKVYTSGPFVLKPIDDFHIEKRTIVPAVKLPQNPIKTKAQDVPTPVNHPTIEHSIPKKVDDAQVGLVDQPNGSGVERNVSENSGKGTEKVDAPIIKTDPNLVVSRVDVEADFAGGINAFRDKFLQNFNADVIENDREMVLKAVVTFVVEKDGSISNVKANSNDVTFNQEVERTIKSIKGKWKPAQYQGEAVRSYFKFPVSMQFD